MVNADLIRNNWKALYPGRCPICHSGELTETAAGQISCSNEDCSFKSGDIFQLLEMDGVSMKIAEATARTERNKEAIELLNNMEMYHVDGLALLRKLEAEEYNKASTDMQATFDFLSIVRSDKFKPYQTGLKWMDDLLGGGFIRQSLILLLAAPGTGKTTLCQQIAETIAEQKQDVIYLNLEMSREQMIAKAISARLARKEKKYYSAKKILQGFSWTPEEEDIIRNAIVDYIGTSYPYIKYNPEDVGSDLDKIISYLQREGERAKAAGKDAPLVIVDYLHLISSSRNMDVKELIKLTVTRLKNDYAMKYDGVVIGIVATNRDAASSGRITMHSARDSSNLEYTADYQISLNYYDIDTGKVSSDNPEEMAKLQLEPYRRMILRVLKSRFDQPGKTANVYFHAETNTFYGEGEWMPADKQRIPFIKKR